MSPLRRRGLEVGEDVFVAFSPERIDPGSQSVEQEAVPRVVGGATPACERAAIELLASATPAHPSGAVAGDRRDDQALGEHVSRCQHRPGQRVLRHLPVAGHRCHPRDRRRRDQAVRVHGVPARPRGRRPLHPVRPALPAVAAASQPGRGTPDRPRRCSRSPLGRAGSSTASAASWPSAGTPVAGTRILVVGVAYKPDVADVRESPALEILQRLRDAGASVGFVDAHVPDHPAGRWRGAALGRRPAGVQARARAAAHAAPRHGPELDAAPISC